MSLTIDNIGPIEHLELDARPGTITVLRGMNGEGKSTVLETVDAITRGAGKLSSRDGTTGGKATGFGVTIKVGRGGANRRTGDLVVTAIEDRLSIADFVEPNLKDPYAADGRRLKALVSLAGVDADQSIYHELAGGAQAFAEFVKPQSLEATDPITLAENIKRDFEAQSRLARTRAERLFGEITAKRKANEGLNLQAESSEAALQKGLELWLAESAALNERMRLAAADRERREQAQRALASAAAIELTRLEQAEAQAVAEVDATEQERCELKLEIDELRQKLNAAEDKLQGLNKTLVAQKCAVDSARSATNSARQQAEQVEEWRAFLDSPAIAAPATSVMDAAADEVQKAREAYSQGVLIRAALKREQEAELLEADRKAAVEQADRLRDGAKSVLEALAGQVKGLVPGLKLDPELRIIVPHQKRGECFYSDLSHGERWTMALDIAVAAFQRKGQPGVMAIPQEAWEGLDGRNRKLIAEHVAKKDLIVFTAEAERSIGHGSGIEVDVLAAN